VWYNIFAIKAFEAPNSFIGAGAFLLSKKIVALASGKGKHD